LNARRRLCEDAIWGSRSLLTSQLRMRLRLPGTARRAPRRCAAACVLEWREQRLLWSWLDREGMQDSVPPLPRTRRAIPPQQLHEALEAFDARRSQVAWFAGLPRRVRGSWARQQRAPPQRRPRRHLTAAFGTQGSKS